MSLDISIIKQRWISYDEGKTFTEDYSEILYESNITHNLTEMADKAGIYNTIWRPYKLLKNYNLDENADYKLQLDFEDNNKVYAIDLIENLENGYKKLRDNHKYFQSFNPKNGWGSYETLLNFVVCYLDECKKYPNGLILVCR
jgi:hypothetical protein